MKFKLFLLAVLTISWSCRQQHKEVRESIAVTGGLITGVDDDASGIRVFKGIPFAAPPVGDLRWKAPQPVVPWEGVKACTEFGPSPMQAKPSPFMFWSSEFLIPAEPISEDCLYLNVWTGAKSAEEARPVLVYIYGGGFRSGGTGCAIYDGMAMAGKGVVFVSINYRVGTFGFLAHPELSEESTYGTSGNYGILDMIVSLQWVKENIRAFGGDPENVTIAGQSAGAFGVNFLTASPLAKGLFHRAIAQSGGSFLSHPSNPPVTLAAAEKRGKELVGQLGANSITELRSMSAEEILNAPNAFAWVIQDGYVLPEPIVDIYSSGNQNDVPLLVGWNANDIVMGEPMNEANFRKRVSERFGNMTGELFQAYPVNSSDDVATVQFNMNRDEIFGVQVYTWAKLQSRTGDAPVYVYNFNRALPAHTPATQFGAFHSGEIVYAYNNLHTLDRPWEEADHAIADAMSSYWANFVNTGDPNGEALPNWPVFDLESEKVLQIDTQIESAPLSTKEKLRFWENFFGSQVD